MRTGSSLPPQRAVRGWSPCSQQPQRQRSPCPHMALEAWELRKGQAATPSPDLAVKLSRCRVPRQLPAGQGRAGQGVCMWGALSRA